jgi:hypothetical protein
MTARSDVSADRSVQGISFDVATPLAVASKALVLPEHTPKDGGPRAGTRTTGPCPA